MSKETERNRFTKVASDLLLDVRELVNWGMDTGNTTPEMMWHTVAEITGTLPKLLEAGWKKAAIAKHYGIRPSALSYHIQKLNKSVRNSKTGSAVTKAHRAATGAKAAAGGVTDAPTDKYRVILADPPWRYAEDQTNEMLKTYNARDHYPTMALDEICSMPVKEWADADAVLFLWVPSPILEESFQVVRAWGFRYKASFVWDKIKHNMGHYNSVRHEFLLICTRGACQPDVKQLFDSVQSIERSGKHSQKPAEFFDIIETNYTHGRRLEMFARARREGWDVYAHRAELKVVA
jgi:N6-adenosine-specific RNA methylase IME4